MTDDSHKLNLKGCDFAYDYENKCDCSEDDRCGCSYPNNIPHDFSLECSDGKCLNGSPNSINTEKVEIQTPNVHIKKDSVCVCSPNECECTIVRDEYAK